MSIKYSLTFLLLAMALAAAAVAVWDASAVVAAGFLYAAWAFVAVGVAYACAWPRVFLKGADGRRHPLSWLLLGPYLALLALSLFLYRLTSQGPAQACVAPNLFFGRRLTRREARKSSSVSYYGVLDLTAEFSEVPELRHCKRYRSLPILDATAPSVEQLDSAVQWIEQTSRHGPVYVHCALGHGRTASVVIAYLLKQGDVSTVRDGLARLRALRPGVGINTQQRERLRELIEGG